MLATLVVQWQREHGRHGLPWQGTRDPYRVWLSEVMLQQTQVETVKAYYTRFLERFPTVTHLGLATLDDVMPYWAGLGYYSRARNLHRCAQLVVAQWQGEFPRSSEQLASLPGIGRSTAAAIAAFAYGERRPILDGNVKRVFCRYFGIDGNPSQAAVERSLWALVESAVEQAPADLDMAAYTQGLMDLGATCCTRQRPQCVRCPLQATCHAHDTGRQHELPAKKARKTIPDRQCSVLIVLRENAVLLEKQASTGIWANLWSLPRYDNDEALLAALDHSTALPGHTPQKMAGFFHTFSHFRLHIQPWLLRNTGNGLSEPLASTRWVTHDTLENTALPAPIRKLLAGVLADYCLGGR